MNPTGEAKGYAIARKTLINALLAFETLPPESFVLVGAHAVYLRAPESIGSIAPFTLDGDLAANPKKIGRARTIRDRLEAVGFCLRGRTSGLYHLSGAPPDEQYASRVDILVPEGVAHLWRADGYDARDASATLVQPGLELSLVDHSPMSIGPIDVDHDSRSVVVEVAGILALLVAKGWKIGERFEQGSDAFQEVGKDITDVYRLLRVSTVAELRATLRTVPADHNLQGITRTGARYIRSLCSKDGSGIGVLREMLGKGAEVDLMVASLEALAEEFYEIVESSFAASR